MRDEQGVFLGDVHCRYWQGVDRKEEKTCCGGRITTIAFIKCQKKGIIPAESGQCRSNCVEKGTGV